MTNPSKSAQDAPTYLEKRGAVVGRAFGGGIEFFCEGLRLVDAAAGLVAAPGCWVQPPGRIPGAAGPLGGPKPVDVVPVPELPCAWTAIG